MKTDYLKQIFADEIACFLTNFKNLMIELRNTDIQKSREVFMIMNAMKDSSRNFGHEKVEKLVRNLESVYKIVWKNNLKASPDLLALTLITEDHVRDILTNEEFLNNTENITRYLALKARYSLESTTTIPILVQGKKAWSKPELRLIL